MKKTLLSIAFLALLACVPRVGKAADISVDFFYDNLSGGNWIEVADYGYCWQPDVAVSNESWRPYADGYWAYTDFGWTWVSYEDFGWATYHYGRWVRLEDYGWIWVPGRDADLEWGPAWVSWRFGDNYVGWAPLPPDTIALVESRPITGRLDVEFNIGPAYYNFIDVRYFGDPVLRERIVPATQNVTYIQQTVNVTNITYKNQTVYNYGPDIAVINKRSSRPIQRLQIERQANVDVSAAAKSGALTKVQGDKLVVAAPMRVTRSARQAAPHAIKAKVEKAKVERGWSVVGDQKAQQQLKQKIEAQPASTGAAAAGQVGATGQAGVGANASPSATAGTQAGAQTEMGKAKNRRGFPGQLGTGASPAPTAGMGASPAQGASPEFAKEPKTERGNRQNKFEQRVPATRSAAPSSTAETTAPGGTGAGVSEKANTGEVGERRQVAPLERGEKRTFPARPAAGQSPAEATGSSAVETEPSRQERHPKQTETFSQPGQPGPGAGAEHGQKEGGKRLEKRPKGESSPQPTPQ